ncbi:4Fe-4S dicluster domain-containing protein [Thermococcus sp. CX2]|uniref:4Fe-4S dicluster domain-containing protein n=1 Tax=Thermococcus sp. CX2 TaxID=163006 RepID=UPI00143A0853|nr:4Fe-4S dicluster domain-containing protein [Thermococcus sp. CX2]NJE85976.1 4Fe-4S dicluster domain-containing protein [Thermococcus sp. CX2]
MNDAVSDERMWILITPDKCSGCRLCEVACSLEHEGVIWPEASRIRIFEEFPGVNVPHTCVQCPDYPCVNSCNFGALSVDEKTGAVLVDEDKCTECGACVLACPGRVPRIPAGKESVVICDLCGGSPKCVEVCHEAGHDALKLVRGNYRSIYRTFVKDPLEKTGDLARKLYGEELMR